MRTHSTCARSVQPYIHTELTIIHPHRTHSTSYTHIELTSQSALFSLHHNAFSSAIECVLSISECLLLPHMKRHVQISLHHNGITSVIERVLFSNRMCSLYIRMPFLTSQENTRPSALIQRTFCSSVSVFFFVFLSMSEHMSEHQNSTSFFFAETARSFVALHSHFFQCKHTTNHCRAI